MIEINRNPTHKELNVFAALEVVFFGLVAGWVYGKTGGFILPLTIFGIAAAIGVLGYLQPAFMRMIYIGWMTAVMPIGWVVSHVVLAIVFYLVVTPVGLLMRLCGRDPMQRTLDRNAGSYWQPRPPGPRTDRYFRQF